MKVRGFTMAVVTGLMYAVGVAGAADPMRWNDAELATIRSLSLSSLPPAPTDPSNRWADDPMAAELGRRLFFDTRLSANGTVSCASCHKPDRGFQDDLSLARGIGVVPRRTMPLAGVAYLPWLFWDGRKDSLWSQALGPLESPVEHGSNRKELVGLVARHYANDYTRVFGGAPDVGTHEGITRTFVNIGKAIAAYERRLLPTEGRFDRFAQSLLAGGNGDGHLDARAQGGLKLFLGKGGCVNCHNGPLLTDGHFHNTGVLPVYGLPLDEGRSVGVAVVADDPFNCLGRYSDAAPSDCSELRFMTKKGEALVRAYRTASLRGVANRTPFMHAGQLATLDDAVAHYNTAPLSLGGRSELRPLGLTLEEQAQLTAFLRALDGGVVERNPLHVPPKGMP